MAVDAVVGGVQRAVLKPLDRDIAGVACVLHLGVRSDPGDALAVLAPEAVGILDRARVHLLVLGVVDGAALLPLGRNIINLVVGHRILHATQHSPKALLLLTLCDGPRTSDKAPTVPLSADYQPPWALRQLASRNLQSAAWNLPT